MRRQADEQLATRRAGKQNYHGEEIREHGLAEAERLIVAGLRERGLEKGELSGLRRSDARKAEIARVVRAQTAVPLNWLARRLHMGTPMTVSRLSRNLWQQEYSHDPGRENILK